MTVADAATAFLSIAFLVYLVVLQGSSTMLVFYGWMGTRDYVRRRPLRSYRDVGESPLSMPVSIIVPGYNEAATVVNSVRSLLRSDFRRMEIVVVNDGSTDETRDRMIEAFEMVEIHKVPHAGLPARPVRAVFVGASMENVVLIDKENGGKADALNAGINYAEYPLICSIDADTLLDPGALSRLVWEFQADPTTVAVGGIVRVVNGSKFRDGELVEVRTPPSLLANLQIIEYLRAFFGARIGWSRTKMLLIISGAFGLFRRDAVIAAGGYDPTTVGEDAELVLRLHRSRADLGLPCRITFFPDPICWTEVPGDLRTLTRQRDRWQRGLAQMLWKHKGMLFRRRYGRTGSVALPYFWLFELLAPVVEVLGVVAVVIGLIIGSVGVDFAIIIALIATVYGIVLSFVVILMDERAYKVYADWGSLSVLGFSAVVENLGYRQYLALVRLRAFWTLWRNKGWGEMRRVGFGGETGSDASEDA